MPDKAQPGRTIGSCFGSIVFREHPADDVFVDIDAKGVRNLLYDAGTATTRIAALELDDRVDVFLRWPFWAGAPMTSRREKPAIFAFLGDGSTMSAAHKTARTAPFCEDLRIRHGLRIPTKSAGDSGRSRPPVPIEASRAFR